MSGDFDELDGFNINTGIEVNDFEDSFEDSMNIEDKGETIDFGSDIQVEQEDHRSVKKTAIIAAIIGFILIIAAFGLSTLVRTLDNTNKVGENKPTESVTESVENSNKKVSDSGWVEFTKDNGVEFDTEIDSNFTVTSIQHLAKVVNENNDKIVKSIVKGNISGLIGTYEVEVPYEKARYLKVGSVFSIKYICAVKNGIKIIGEIKY